MQTQTRQNKTARRLKWVARAAGLTSGLALAVQLELNFNKQGEFPLPITWLGGGLGGLLLGWLATIAWRGRFERTHLRIVVGLWLGMIGLAGLAAGLSFWNRAAVPMDWRPVLSVGLISTLPGLAFGWMFSWLVSRDMVRAEPVIVISQTLECVKRQLEAVQGEYPGSSGQVYQLPNGNSATQVQVPFGNEVLIFYLILSETYPQNPPQAVAVEIVLPDGRTQDARYDAPILYYWNDSYGLRHIIQEALRTLVR